MKKRIWAVIMLASLGMLSGCGIHHQKVVSSHIQTATINKRQTMAYLMAGKIEAAEKADISSKITAKVEVIYVSVGSAVKRGAPLIKLDTRDLEAQVAQSRAALDSARSNAQNAKSTYDRNQQLFADGLISKSDFEQYQTTWTMAEASFQSAQSTLELTQTLFDNGIIRSPMSGVVSNENIKAGEMAIVPSTTGEVPLLTIVNPESIVVNAYIPATLLSRVRLGQQVVMKIAEIPEQKFAGEIAVIDSVIDSKNKDILVKVKFKDQNPLFKPGMFVEIGLTK
jgi:RND family efflux transporter, MFP subunit